MTQFNNVMTSSYVSFMNIFDMQKGQKATTLFVISTFIRYEQIIQKAAAELKCGSNDKKKQQQILAVDIHVSVTFKNKTFFKFTLSILSRILILLN